MLIFCYFLTLAYAEYQIKERVIPSYLYYSFYNLSENIFPNDITIVFSLSRMPGTLLYSMDSQSNQLIVSLTDANTPTLECEINKQIFYVSFSELCECITCKYETLRLRIQLTDMMHLQCNTGRIQSFKYELTRKFNTNYPILKFNETNNLQAHLWLVNTPYMDGIYPNSAQLSGCIFEVLYKNEPLTMEKYGVGDRCQKTCTKDICHFGKCLETYNSLPVCNCTESFQNGQFCNDTFEKGNVMEQPFQFKAIKLSFKSNSNNILVIKNKLTSLELIRKERDLFLMLNFSGKHPIIITATIIQGYVKESENIIIIVLNEKNLDVMFRSNSSTWTQFKVVYDQDLSRTIFDRITLERNGGYVDLRYKNDVKEFRWHKLELDNRNISKISLKSSTEMKTLIDKDKSSLTDKNINEDVRVKKLSEEFKSVGFKVNLMFGIVLVSTSILFIIFATALYIFKTRIKNKKIQLPEQSLILLHE